MTKTQAKRIARQSLYRDEDGWWADLPDGWCEAGNPGCHGIHEDTKAEVLRGIADITPCECSGQCTRASR